MFHKIVDRRTGERIGFRCWASREEAERQITRWQNQHDVGASEFTRDQLLNMSAFPVFEKDRLALVEKEAR